MKLLDEKLVQDTNKKSFAEQEERVRKLQEEEIQSVKRLNDALLVEREEIAASKNRLADFAKSQEELAAALTIEVHDLEKRKRDALAPIQDREMSVKIREHDVAEAERTAKELKNTLRSRIASMQIARSDYESRMRQFDIKEQDLIHREEKLAEEKNDFDRNSNAKESRLRDEWNRLRKYFEEEDAKLKAKSL